MAKFKKKKVEKEAGRFLGHYPCIFDDCGSSDAGACYEHEDGSHSFSCFSCGKGVPEIDITTMTPVSVSSGKEINWEEELEKLEEVRDGLIAVSNKERKLKASIYEKYGCRMELNEEDGETIDTIYYPTYRHDHDTDTYEHVGYRNRRRFSADSPMVKKKPNLEGVLKDFSGGIGDTKKGICMFGQWLFDPKSQKRVIVCCGEEDAMAVYDMTSRMTKFDGGYPSVSVPSGESVNGVKPHLRWLSAFEEIYIIPDQDETGLKFGKSLAKLLPVGKVRIVKLPEGKKDPCDMWKFAGTKDKQQRIAQKFWRCLWDAEKYSPVGVMSLSEGWDAYRNRGKEVKVAFPESFGDLNERTFGGAALGEIVNIIAPSSVGKSTFVKVWFDKILKATPYNIGVLSLEETVDEFIEGMLSVYMGVQLNEIPEEERNRSEEWEQFQEMIHHYPIGFDQEEEDRSNDERIHFVDHQGSCSGDDLLEKVDFLINGLDCKVLVLDPVTLACSGSDVSEDDMASEILKRVKKHNILWINVQHVRKNGSQQTANSEGGDLSEEDIKGTGAWFQTGMINLIFTRNKVHSNPIIRNTTKIKMSKCRRHGKNTGIVGYTYYNGETGLLEKGLSPEEILGDEDEFEDHDDNPLNSFE